MFRGALYYFAMCWRLDKRFPVVILLKEILNAIKTVMTVVLPKFIIDALFTTQNKEEAVRFLLIYAGTLFAISLITAVLNRSTIILKSISFQRFQADIGKKLMQIDYERLETPEFLNLKQKADQYAYSGGYGFAVILEDSVGLFGKLLTFAGLISVIAILSPWLVLAVIIIVALNSLVFAKTNKHGIKYRMEQSVQERRIGYYSKKMEDFQYGKEIRTYNLAPWFLEKYNQQIKVLGKFYNNIANTRFISGAFNSFTFAIQLIISYFFVIKQTLDSALSVGNFTMYLAAVSSFASILSEIIKTVVQLSQFNTYFEAFKEYINMPSMENTKGGKPILPENFDIEFQNISFKYGTSEKFALQNVNVKFNSKERIAIIGENGAGKSTFVKLLMRLYEPTEGKILINGINVKEIDYNHYQTWFAAVFQDFKLFSFSIKENITFGNDKTEEDKKRLENIVSASGLKEVTDKLDKGLETLVYRDFDDAGFTPSGGEGQKIAIARAAYKNAPIVILDEPTAALDPKAENKIYEQFDSFFADKCSLYISHRMAVTKFSDRTLVFDNARIVQDGNHDTLISQEGKYKELYNLQAKYYTDEVNSQ